MIPRRDLDKNPQKSLSEQVDTGVYKCSDGKMYKWLHFNPPPVVRTSTEGFHRNEGVLAIPA